VEREQPKRIMAGHFKFCYTDLSPKWGCPGFDREHWNFVGVSRLIGTVLVKSRSKFKCWI